MTEAKMTLKRFKGLARNIVGPQVYVSSIKDLYSIFLTLDKEEKDLLLCEGADMQAVLNGAKLALPEVLEANFLEMCKGCHTAFRDDELNGGRCKPCLQRKTSYEQKGTP